MGNDNKASTVSGYEVRAGKVQPRTLYATRKDAALHLESFKGVRGFAVRWGGVIETLTTRKHGRNFHQQIGGNGYSWKDYAPPYVTRRSAEAAWIKDLRRRVSRGKRELREAERALAKAVRK